MSELRGIPISSVVRSLIDAEIKKYEEGATEESRFHEQQIQTRENENKYLQYNLNRLRRFLAATEGIPYFWVFTNRVIDEICHQRPKSFVQLRRIPMMGRKRIQKYGYYILHFVEMFTEVYIHLTPDGDFHVIEEPTPDDLQEAEEG